MLPYSINRCTCSIKPICLVVQRFSFSFLYFFIRLIIICRNINNTCSCKTYKYIVALVPLLLNRMFSGVTSSLVISGVLLSSILKMSNGCVSVLTQDRHPVSSKHTQLLSTVENGLYG